VPLFLCENGAVLTGLLVFLVEELLNLVTDLTLGELDVVLGGTVIRHEGEEAVVGHVKLKEA